MSPYPGFLILGWAPAPAPLFVAVEGLFADDLFYKGPHPYTPGDQPRTSAMHCRKKFAACTVNACDLPHVNFDFFAGARG